MRGFCCRLQIIYDSNFKEMKLSQVIVFTLTLFIGQALFSQNQYSFFVAGHTYGQPGVDNIGLHPPFKEKFSYIQSRSEIKFGVFTGDIVKSPSEQDWDEVDSDILNLGLPIYFAVGNHDMYDRDLFESRYGSTYFNFIYENDLFIVLDPNIDKWNISGEQLIFLQNTVNENSELVDNIFIFFHQILWRENYNIYRDIIPNSTAGRADSINFWSEVEPLFHNLPNNTVMFAGDFGATWKSTNVMYDNYDNITFIGSGMGLGPYKGDNFIIINVNTNKTITYDLICLNNDFDCLGELTSYDIPSEVSLQKDIFIYPNPTNKYINLIFNNINYELSNISIYNLVGKKYNLENYIKVGLNKIQLNTSNLKTGLYILEIITDDNTVITKKIMISNKN